MNHILRYILAGIQIYGGVIGIVTLGVLEMPWFFKWLGLTLFILSVVSGMLLGLNRKLGFPLSRLNFALQVVGVGLLSTFLFNYHSGVHISLGMDFVETSVIIFNFGLYSEFAAGLGTAVDDNHVMINVFAIWCFAKCMRVESGDSQNKLE